jgi:predicted transposase YdaD
MNSKVNQTQDLNDSQQQDSQQNSKYFIHKDASAEVKKWLAEAQKRLEYFAGQPAQREAYEQELMFILDHNTAIKQHHEEGFIEGKAEGLAEGKAEGISAGRASLLPSFIQTLKADGRSEEEICIKLGLSEEEQKLYFK